MWTATDCSSILTAHVLPVLFRTQESVAAPTKVVPKLNLGGGSSSCVVPRLALKKQPAPPISFSHEAAENSSRSYLDGFDDITELADSCPTHPLAVGSHVEVTGSRKRGIVEELEPGDDDVCVVLADGGCQAVFSRKELLVDCSCKSGHTTLLLMQEQPKTTGMPEMSSSAARQQNQEA